MCAFIMIELQHGSNAGFTTHCFGKQFRFLLTLESTLCVPFYYNWTVIKKNKQIKHFSDKALMM